MNEPFAHRFTLREEGQVELTGRPPTDLARVRYCETCRKAVNAIFRNEEAFLAADRQRQMIYEIKLTANSCIALWSSKNAVNISSARTMKRFP